MMTHRFQKTDVVIVGGGPAGSTLAGLLADRNIDTVVLDRSRFPRQKPCGECINPGGVATLERLGLLSAVLRNGAAHISGWRMTTHSGAEARGSYRHGDGGSAGYALGLSRNVLDAALLQESKRRGAQVFEHVAVNRLQFDRVGGGRRASVTVGARDLDGGSLQWKARMVVGADGLRSVVARRLGLVRRRPGVRKVSVTCRLSGTGPSRRTGALFLTDWGTIGLAPVHSRHPLWNGTVVAYKDRGGRAVSADLVGWFRAAFRKAPFQWDGGAPQIIDGPWTSGPFDWPTRSAISDGAVLIGDASGYFDPLTGQGMFRAFRSAELATPVIARAIRSGRAAVADLVDYQRGLRLLVGPTRVLQRGIEAALARPRIRDVAIAGLGAAEPVADAVVQVVGDALPVWGLARPYILASLVRQGFCRVG